MEKNENVVKELKKIYPSEKRKKFVYLDKYEAYKETVEKDNKILHNRINVLYIILGIIVIIEIINSVK